MKVNNEMDQYKQRKAKSASILMLWTVAWVVTMAITAFAPRFLWDYNTALSMVSVVINLVTGAGMMLANGRHLRCMDELEQKIMLDAMALTLGVGLVVGLSYELFEDIKLISFEPEISHLVIIMCLTYAGAQIAGHRKFK